MPIPHQEMRRVIKRRIHGLEGAERIRTLTALLEELPGYYQGPYGELRKWVLDLIEEARLRSAVKHQDGFFLPRQGAAQIALVGPPSAGKSSLLHALTGRQVMIADYAFTTLRPVDGMVSFDGAQIQLVDLPGLIAGAADGKGGGKSVLAAMRIADAALIVLPLTAEADAAASLIRALMVDGEIDLRCGVVATKADLAGAARQMDALRAAIPDLPFAACSVVTGSGVDWVRDLVWSLSELIRVFCRPRQKSVSPDAVVLRRGATVADLAQALNRAWLPILRSARVTGPSARFPDQSVGAHHVLADGDVVELEIR